MINSEDEGTKLRNLDCNGTQILHYLAVPCLITSCLMIVIRADNHQEETVYLSVVTLQLGWLTHMMMFVVASFWLALLIELNKEVDLPKQTVLMSTCVVGEVLLMSACSVEQYPTFMVGLIEFGTVLYSYVIIFDRLNYRRAISVLSFLSFTRFLCWSTFTHFSFHTRPFLAYGCIYFGFICSYFLCRRLAAPPYLLSSSLLHKKFINTNNVSSPSTSNQQHTLKELGIFSDRVSMNRRASTQSYQRSPGLNATRSLSKRRTSLPVGGLKTVRVLRIHNNNY